MTGAGSFTATADTGADGMDGAGKERIKVRATGLPGAGTSLGDLQPGKAMR